MLMQSSVGWSSKRVIRSGLLDVFAGTGVQVTPSVRLYSGAALGYTTFIDSFTQQCVSEWTQGVSRLSSYAETQLSLTHHAAFTHAIMLLSPMPWVKAA